MNRREFLRSAQSLLGLAAAGSLPGLTLFPRLLSASQVPDSSMNRFFVMIRAGGGWDVTLGLDPFIHQNGTDQHDMFIEYAADQILSARGLRFGPACAPLLKHASDIGIINGVFMTEANVSHPANLDYISTGNIKAGSAELPVEIASAGGPIGTYGVVFNQTLTRANRTAVLPTTVRNLMSLRTSIDLSRMVPYISGLNSRGKLREAIMSQQQNRHLQTRLIELMASLSAEIDAKSTKVASTQTDIVDARRSGAVVAAAFASRGAYQAKIDLTTFLDTHSSHRGVHLSNQTQVWQAVSDIFTTFKKVPLLNSVGEEIGSLFDHTTFAVVSEFSRTPSLNASNGKDHNPLTNSVLLAGAGVRGGQCVGASRLISRREAADGQSRHSASPIHYETARVAESRQQADAAEYQFIFPENVAATIAEIMKVDRNQFTNISPMASALKQFIR